jgi:D-alanine-D-alanine ligase
MSGPKLLKKSPPAIPLTIGLTYDLRDDYLKAGFGLEETAEFDKPDTIEAIEAVILGMGFKADRIGNIRALAERLTAGDRWDLVFNIAEGLYGFGREAQVPALLDAYAIPYTFSDVLGHAVTLHKGITKRIVRDLGIPTPDFAVITDEQQIDAVNLPYPLFVKPVAEGTGKGISALSKIDCHDTLRSVCRDLLKKFRQPVLVETYLPGREFTVGIVGTGRFARAIGAMEVILNDTAERHAYTYDNKEHYEDLVRYAVVNDQEAQRAMDVSLAAWRGLDLKDAGRVDLRSDAFGNPQFIEVNSLAGLNPVRSDLPILCRLVGLPYEQLIEDILQSALTRAGLSTTK